MPSIMIVLDKIHSRFEFLRTFIQNMLNYLLSYVGFDADALFDSKLVIRRNINSIILSKNSNIRGLSWFLIQILNCRLLNTASGIIVKLKNSKMQEQIDMQILQTQFQKRNLPITGFSEDDQSEEKLKPENYFNDKYQLEMPDFSDSSVCSRFLDAFRAKQITSLRSLLRSLKRFSKLLTISHTKTLYYPIRLLGILEEWIMKNFGMIEIEFQINIIRLVLGNLEDNRVLVHLMLLEHYSPAEKDNSFVQLFINALTIDIDLKKSIHGGGGV